MINRLPKLPEGTKAELPAASDKMSQHRGSLAWWVISMLGLAFTSLLLLINQNYRKQIDDCHEENQDFKRILIPQLNELDNKLQEVEQKADSLVNKLENIKTK